MEFTKEEKEFLYSMLSGARALKMSIYLANQDKVNNLLDKLDPFNEGE